MATGDLNNNIDKARNELTSIRYDGVWNSLGISEGAPEAYLPLIHHVCVNFSRFLARFLASKGYELVGKNDMRFMEEVYKILRNEFNYRPALNLTQFFTIGFAERKLILVCDVIKLCKRKHNEISKQKADAKRKAVSSPSPSLLLPPSPQVNTPKKDFEPENSLRKSGGSLTKSGHGLDGSQRRRSGSTGSNSGTPTVPKKFVASASLVNNQIDVVDFRPNVSAARPPIRVIRNEPKQSSESISSPSPSHHGHPSPSISHNAPPTSSSTHASPAHFKSSHYSNSSLPINPLPSFPSNPSLASNPTSSSSNPSLPINPLPSFPSNPSFLSTTPPLPSSSAYASRSSTDGAWRVQDAQGLNGYSSAINRYARASGMERGREGEGEREDLMIEVEDVEVQEEEDEGEGEDGSGEDESLPAVFKEFRMNGRVEGEREKKEDNGYSGASMNHIGNGGEAPISDKVAMHILDKLAQMETKVLSSINGLQSSMISLESRVRNLESLLGDSPKRAIYQAPQQPTLSHNNPHKQTINFPSSSSPISSHSYPTYSTLSHSPPSLPHQSVYHVHTSPNGHQIEGNGNNTSDNSSTGSNNAEKDKSSYKTTTQSTQDFISSITKRFKDTRDLLDQQSKQYTSFEHK